MDKYLRICSDSNNRHYIINLCGDILVSADNYPSLVGKYLKKYDSTITELSHIAIIDNSRMIYDERDYYYTENQLKEEFENDSEKLDIYGNFAAYLAEICGKNGTCEYI